MIAGICQALLLLINIVSAQMDGRFITLSELDVDETWTTASLNDDGCLVITQFLSMDSVHGLDLIFALNGAVSSSASITVGNNGWFGSVAETSPTLILIDPFHIRLQWNLGAGEFFSGDGLMLTIIICNPDDDDFDDDWNVQVSLGGVFIVDVEPTSIKVKGDTRFLRSLFLVGLAIVAEWKVYKLLERSMEEKH